MSLLGPGLASSLLPKVPTESIERLSASFLLPPTCLGKSWRLPVVLVGLGTAPALTLTSDKCQLN